MVNKGKLSLRLDTFNQNVIITGNKNNNNNTINHYIRLKNRERLIITCSINGSYNGTLFAFVNTKQATALKCLKYTSDLMVGDDNYCQSKQFAFYAEPDQSSFIDVWCRLTETLMHESNVNLFLLRLCNSNCVFFLNICLFV